ncbi:MAG: c-type cytochrome [Halioglobus sp.]|nr:c-type cytochrome [Halioglobus sp.]
MHLISQSLVVAVLAMLAMPAFANTFHQDLEQVDEALKTNPKGVLKQSLESCVSQRNHAVVLNSIGQQERARRALQYCFDSLHISREDVNKVKATSQAALQARAKKEYEKALTLTPDVANGLAIYRDCAACHEPEGWGRPSGSVPQIAGQHRTVVIKQLADYRAGNRNSALMAPYATVESIGGTQAVADVAEYISTLEISVDNGKGPGTDLELGEKLYREHCLDCHGENGEGSNDDAVPRIQAQHYRYLVRQFEWIAEGTRRNASKKMAKLAEQLSEPELKAVLDYSSRLLPAPELRAPPGWKNPDFE